MLNYLLTATPLAYFLPLCFKRVCQQMKSETQTATVDVQGVASVSASAPASAPPPASLVLESPDAEKSYCDAAHRVMTQVLLCAPGSAAVNAEKLWAQLHREGIDPPYGKKAVALALGLKCNWQVLEADISRRFVTQHTPTNILIGLAVVPLEVQAGGRAAPAPAPAPAPTPATPAPQCGGGAAASTSTTIVAATQIPSFVSTKSQVIFNQDLKPCIQAGITYHVVGINAERSCFQVALRPGGQPLALEIAAFAAAQAQFRAGTEHLRHAAILRCMPAAHPNLEIPSLLDSYFDYHIPLSNLMCQLQSGVADKDMFSDFTEGTTSKNQVGSVSFRKRFEAERRFFNSQLSKMFAVMRDRPPPPEFRPPLHPVFCQHPDFSIDSTSSHHRTADGDSTPKSSNYKAPKVWLGLGHLQTVGSQPFALEFRKPVAFKEPIAQRKQHGARQGSRENAGPADEERMEEFENLMRTLKTGSYIASATKEPNVLHVKPDGSPLFAGGWVSEAGICTLHDLFSRPIMVEERNSLAFRDVLREVSGALRNFV